MSKDAQLQHYQDQLKLALWDEVVDALHTSSHRCEHVHHAKRDQHKATEACSVERRISALLTKIAATDKGE